MAPKLLARPAAALRRGVLKLPAFSAASAGCFVPLLLASRARCGESAAALPALSLAFLPRGVVLGQLVRLLSAIVLEKPSPADQIGTA